MLDFGQDVRAEQDVDTGVGQAGNGLAHVTDTGGVEPVGRFVEDHQCWTFQQRGREGQPAPGSQRVTPVAAAGHVGKTYVVDHLIDPLVGNPTSSGK